MGYQLKTKKGYDFFEASSALQKSIRRNDVKLAGYFALELWHSNYRDYVWKRLLTISAEDCYGIITKEVYALYKSYEVVNKRAKKPAGRIFLSKAVILLCESLKSRDADHLQNLVYDRDDVDAQKLIEEVRNETLDIPEYAYDVHTRKGKRMGKTKEDFFREELEALEPRQKGLFDDLVE